MTFDEDLSALLAMVGQRVEVHVLDAGDTGHLVASFGGRLRAGYSMTGSDPTDTEAISVRLDAGEETAAISLDREVFEGALLHEDEAITFDSAALRLWYLPDRYAPRYREQARKLQEGFWSARSGPPAPLDHRLVD